MAIIPWFGYLLLGLFVEINSERGSRAETERELAYLFIYVEVQQMDRPYTHIRTAGEQARFWQAIGHYGTASGEKRTTYIDGDETEIVH